MPDLSRHTITGSAGFAEFNTRLFAGYGQPFESALLDWLPILLGLISAAVVATVFCPIPRTQTVTGSRAVLVSMLYVFATVATSFTVLFVTSRMCLRAGQLNVGRIFAPFCGVVAWVTPTAAFYARGSFWAVFACAVLAAKSASLIFRWNRETKGADAPPENSRSVEDTNSRTMFPMVLAAVLFHLAAVSAAGGMARLTAGLMGTAVFMVTWCGRRAAEPQRREPRASLWRSSTTAGLAVTFVAASFAPYLALESGGGSPDLLAGNTPPAKGPQINRAVLKPRNASWLQAARSLFRDLLPESQRTFGGDERNGKTESGYRPYPTLQAIFGSPQTAGPESGSSKRTSAGRLSAVVAGDSYSGMILRPEVKDQITLVPPLPKRRIFGENPTERKADAVSVPFYGAYWYFRASEKTLPTDAAESRGDPASIEFRTTDFTPITMEARQNFGSLIALSCCKAIEIHISNGDRRPNTVAIELILKNTRLPGQPSQSLGVHPVNSTLHWYPGDDRPPMSEVLSFLVPAQSALHSFDEAVIHFHLKFRIRHSAKIAIQRFRLIPAGV